MKNPEGGHGEIRDTQYFMQKIERLYNEAVSSKQPDIAAVLASLRGILSLEAVSAGTARELANLCADFSQQKLIEMGTRLNKPKN